MVMKASSIPGSPVRSGDLRATPGVISAAQVGIVPVAGWSSEDELRLEGRPEVRMPTKLNGVSGRYFETMRTPLVAGRDFDERDVVGSPAVVIVNQSFARQYLGGAPVLGRRLLLHTGPHLWSGAEIVGVVADTTYADLRQPFQPIVYRASSQDADAGSSLTFVVRSGLPSASLRSAVARAMTDRSPEISLSFEVYPSLLRDTLLRERLMATLSGFFGVLALVLAGVGLYGVMSYMVARRRSEIAIRLALGADRRSIVRMVMREALAMVGIGLAIGLLLTLIASTAAKALLFGLTPTDPTTMVVAVGALALVGLASSYLPAERAARLEPTHVLPEN